MKKLIGSIRPIAALVLLSPFIAELLTGSTPVTMLVLSPAAFALQLFFIIGLYGSGVLLVHEAAVRWGKGWGTIMLLGGAYGIMEEGVGVHTFFETSGSPVGIMGSYGHLFGINWVWATGLTVFHSIYSISLPILMAGLFFPDHISKPWMDRGLTAAIMAVYLSFVTFFYFLVGSKPGSLQLALCIAAVIALVWTAHRLPPDFLKVGTGRRKGRPLVVAAGSALFFSMWIVVDGIATGNLLPPAASIALLTGSGLASYLAVRYGAGSAASELVKVWICTGLLSVIFLWDVLMEFIAVPGILGVTALFIYLLARMRAGVRLRVSAGRSGPQAG